jgi:hypothetical protein
MDREYKTIFEKENLRKEDIYMQKESKIIILKYPESEFYKLLTDFVEETQSSNKLAVNLPNNREPDLIQEKGRLL